MHGLLARRVDLQRLRVDLGRAVHARELGVPDLALRQQQLHLLARLRLVRQRQVPVVDLHQLVPLALRALQPLQALDGLQVAHVHREDAVQARVGVGQVLVLLFPDGRCLEEDLDALPGVLDELELLVVDAEQFSRAVQPRVELLE